MTQTFAREAEATVEVSIAGEAGHIGATAEHPFYARRARSDTSGEGEGEWVPAGELMIGDVVRRQTGAWARVDGVERRAGRVQVFNFEVAGNHNYFVGKLGVLVHNECPGPGTLTTPEFKTLQDIADEFDTTIDLVGSRGAGRGRNIDTDLPFDKGPNTRSDIDLRIDHQIEFDTGGALSHTLLNNLPGADVRTRLPGGSYAPYIPVGPRR